MTDFTVTVTVAEDGHSAVIAGTTEHGLYTQTLYWPNEVVDEAIVRARLDTDTLSYIVSRMQVGEGSTVRRIIRAHGTLWLHHYWGPPTWWLPRFVPMFIGLRFGWLNHAFVVQWRFGKPDVA